MQGAGGELPGEARCDGNTRMLGYLNVKEDSEHLAQPAEPPSRCPNTDLAPRSRHPLEVQESDAPQMTRPKLENHWNETTSTPVAPSTGTDHPRGQGELAE